MNPNTDPDSKEIRTCVLCGASDATLGVCRSSGPVYTSGPYCRKCGGGDRAATEAEEKAVRDGYPPWSIR